MTDNCGQVTLIGDPIDLHACLLRERLRGESGCHRRSMNSGVRGGFVLFSLQTWSQLQRTIQMGRCERCRLGKITATRLSFTERPKGKHTWGSLFVVWTREQLGARMSARPRVRTATRAYRASSVAMASRAAELCSDSHASETAV